MTCYWRISTRLDTKNSCVDMFLTSDVHRYPQAIGNMACTYRPHHEKYSNLRDNNTETTYMMYAHQSWSYSFNELDRCSGHTVRVLFILKTQTVGTRHFNAKRCRNAHVAPWIRVLATCGRTTCFSDGRACPATSRAAKGQSELPGWKLNARASNLRRYQG